MDITIHKLSEAKKKGNLVILVKNIDKLKHFNLNNEELKYIKKLSKEDEKKSIAINRLGEFVFVEIMDSSKEKFQVLESLRKSGDRIQKKLNANKIKEFSLIDADNLAEESLALLEGILLGSYEFIKYKDKKDLKANTLDTLAFYTNKVKDEQFEALKIVTEATLKARTLVNEPLSYLTADKLAEEIVNMGKDSGAKVEVLNFTKIKSLKMGGLLAVNKGSVNPPTFTIIEWKPKDAINKKPYIFVGKGIVFDTGGMNLKPGASMSDMKCDMSGAACAASSLYAIAKAKLPVYVIALVPATENRPDGNAYVPGDVITMFSGKTVEVLNTDAEGRLILADALHYAKKFDPELVIDIATLTGSAHAAVGSFGIVAMGSNLKKEMEDLKQSGNNVYERIAEFPFWEEYGEELKSDIADLKNIGSRYAGAITAGKFLENFTDYPWIHLDIAGPAYLDKKDSYRGKGGSGVGVRLLFDFIKNRAK